MSSAKVDALRVSTSARVFALFASLLVVAFTLAGTTAFFASERAAELDARDRISLDMQAMEIELDTEGFEPMLAAIRARADQPGAMRYRLVGTTGAVEIDELRIGQPAPGWIRRIGDGSESVAGAEFVVLTRSMRGGVLLSIGSDLREAEAVRASVLSALAWSGIGALTIGLLVGAILTRRSLAKVDEVSRAVSRFAEGDLGVRAPSTRGRVRDDIDVIAEGINQMLDRIEVLVESVRRVSTAVAHDLRTPLTHVRQRLETAVEPSMTEADRIAAAEAAQADIDEVLRTFAAILSLSEIEATGQSGTFETIELASLAESVADAYSADIEASGRTLGLGPLASVRVRGDRRLLGRAIANLLENAMRHTREGATIALSVSDASGVARLEVVDDGPGLSSEERMRAVEPWYRADRSRSTQGSGLGLAIVSAIAARHGARLTLQDAAPGLRVVLEFEVANGDGRKTSHQDEPTGVATK